MEPEDDRFPGHKELPFDISILTDKEAHDGFFAVVFRKENKSPQAHWDKMSGQKFGQVIESIFSIAIANDLKNLDMLINMLLEYKKNVILDGERIVNIQTTNEQESKQS